MEKIINRFDLTYLGNAGDAGERYEFYCPECGDKITVAESGWWDTECSCGFDWNLEIIVKGTKD